MALSDRPLNVARMLVVETAAATLSEGQLQMPFSQLARGKALAPRILGVKFSMAPSGHALADAVNLDRLVLSTRQGLTVVPNLDNPGTIASLLIASKTTTDGVAVVQHGDDWNFTPHGLLVPAITLSLYIQGAGTSILAGRAMITYIVDEIEADELLAALSVFGALV